MITNCTHKKTICGQDYCFAGPVAQEPYTHENRAAHGGICYTETCRYCGDERSVNANQMHQEVGPWGASKSERDLKEKESDGEASRKAMDKKAAPIIDEYVGSARLRAYAEERHWSERSTREIIAESLEARYGAIPPDDRAMIADLVVQKLRALKVSP